MVGVWGFVGLLSSVSAIDAASADCCGVVAAVVGAYPGLALALSVKPGALGAGHGAVVYGGSAHGVSGPVCRRVGFEQGGEGLTPTAIVVVVGGGDVRDFVEHGGGCKVIAPVEVSVA